MHQVRRTAPGTGPPALRLTGQGAVAGPLDGRRFVDRGHARDHSRDGERVRVSCCSASAPSDATNTPNQTACVTGFRVDPKICIYSCICSRSHAAYIRVSAGVVSGRVIASCPTRTRRGHSRYHLRDTSPTASAFPTLLYVRCAAPAETGLCVESHLPIEGGREREREETVSRPLAAPCVHELKELPSAVACSLACVASARRGRQADSHRSIPLFTDRRTPQPVCCARARRRRARRVSGRNGACS